MFEPARVADQIWVALWVAALSEDEATAAAKSLADHGSTALGRIIAAACAPAARPQSAARLAAAIGRFLAAR